MVESIVVESIVVESIVVESIVVESIKSIIISVNCVVSS